MSNSYLPNRNTPYSEHEAEREARLPVQRGGDAGYAGHEYYNASDQMSGKEQVQKAIDLLARRKWIVLVGFLVSLTVAVAYTLTETPQYETATFVQLDLGKVTVDIGKRLSTGDESTDAGYELFARNDRSLAGEIRLLEISSPLEQRVKQRLQNESSLVDSSAQQGEGMNPRRFGRVRFEIDRGSDNIIRFVGVSSDASHAAILANIYAEEYVRLTRDASRSSATALQKSLEERERQQQTELNLVEEQIKSFKQQGGIGLDQDAERLNQQIASLEVQREDALVEVEEERATLASLEQQLEEINPQVAERIASNLKPRIDALQAALAEEESERQQILLENPELRGRETTALRSRDERIRRMREEVDSLSRQYVSEVDAAGGITGSADGLTYMANLRAQITEKRSAVSRMEARLRVVESRLANYQSEIRVLPEQSLELAQMERNRLRAEQIYQRTAEQLEQAYIAEESEQGYAQILRRAQIPAMVAGQDLNRNLFLGVFFGLLLGVALAVVRDTLDSRIYQSEQLRRMGLKEIGVIPNMKPMIKKNYRGNPFLDHNGRNFSTSLIPLLMPVSATSEAYRYIRTNIQYGFPDMRVQTLLIASSGVSEGKSTTAANLAIVMAQAGRSTLLIDADLRRPSLHRMFGLWGGESGLSELLSNGSYFDPDSWRTDVENLFVLTAGNPVDQANGNPGPTGENALANRGAYIMNPSELLGSGRMREFIDAARETFDIIIIDTPPVLVATDTALLSAQCDATLVVARAGVTKEGELDLTIEALENVGARVIGVLLNGIDIGMSSGHRYKYQHYAKYEQPAKRS